MKEILNNNETANGIKPVLPTVFSSVEEAVKVLKLDKRHKWYEFQGEISRDVKCTLRCSGCDGGGCFECGYQGKRVNYFPVPLYHPLTNEPIKVLSIK